ncbi:MAG: hypothetical protein GXO15_04300, partial [Crenarchaeota archaeon]|nr:hypothetical protein [Thermoproteota archaeon]
MASHGAQPLQLPGRVVAWRCRGSLGWRDALAIGEHLLDLALGQGVAHAASCRVDGS